MELVLILLSISLLLGSIATLFAFKPDWLPALFSSPSFEAEGEHKGIESKPVRGAKSPKEFSLQNTLLIIGPEVNHPACRLQRKLLKPTIPMIIREDIAVMEVYGSNHPRKNGETLPWLDQALLRHALNAEDGFFVVYVDRNGKTLFRKQSPMLAEMIADSAGIPITPTHSPTPTHKSNILRRLQAA